MAEFERIPLNITSEYGVLKTVILHCPGLEIDKLTPENKNSLLFEDVPFLEKMVEEHKNFVRVIEEHGIRVLLLKDLLTDVFKHNSLCRDKIVQKSCILQKSLAPILLDNYDSAALVNILLSGISVSQLKEETGIDFTSIKSQDDPFLLEPVPNAYFTRDPAAVIADKVVSSKMHFDARVRETYFFQEIFKHHPSFKSITPYDEDNINSNFIFGDGVSQDEEKPFCIEGGDIIILHEKAIAIGCSQRTRSETIAKLAANLFNQTKVQRVYQINIPAERAYMHLDTVFTIVDRGIVVAYPNVMDDVKEIIRYEPQYFQNMNKAMALPIIENRKFNTLLEDEFGIAKNKLTVVSTGNNIQRYAAREQIADGTNVFAIAPGKVITYDRNIHTNQALESVGVKVIKIEGSELVRGLGGPRCMTMPIQRENI